MKTKIIGKILAIGLLLAISLNLSACCCTLPFSLTENLNREHPSHAAPMTTIPIAPLPMPETTEPIPETAAPMPEPTWETTVPEMTLNTETLYSFLSQAKGIWIFNDTICHMYDDQYNFEVLIISDTNLNTGVYPGGLDRPGVFEKVEYLGNNTYTVHLLFEEGYFYDEYLPESRNSFQIAFPANGQLTMLFDDGTQYYLTYGGADFEEANRIAGILF